VSQPLAIGIGRAGVRGNNGQGELMHGGHVLDMRRPLRQSPK
jgi:hypothetical protein